MVTALDSKLTGNSVNPTPSQILVCWDFGLDHLIPWQSCNSVTENMYHSCLCLLNLTNHYEVLKTDVLLCIKGHFCWAQVLCDSVWIKCHSEIWILVCVGWVVKALDLKSNGHYPRSVLAEWLRRWTWNPMGITRVGSNPAPGVL